VNARKSHEHVFKHILFDVADRVARITLNDPARMNAISNGPGSMKDEIVQALEIADADKDIRCVIITGAGNVFSAGGDLGGGHPEGSVFDSFNFLDGASQANDKIRALRKPTIGAINGICYGAGLIFAMHLDLLVAVEDARFGMIETRFGGCGVELLPFFIGTQWAKFLALSGEIITAKRAQEIGLILEVLSRDTFDHKVDDLARRVAAMPRHGVMFNRRLLNAVSDMAGWTTMQKQLAIATNAIIMSLHGEARAADGRLLFDILAQEGWKAFKEARDKAFKTPWLES
jgi:enoyl-CoA hydratase/carnithine racemase